jgi:5-(carboxyamino)imidazole ribonucleotide synthase
MKVGILGGGQLGRMLLQAAANYPVETFILENDTGCPSAHLCHHFIKGDISDYETVLQFGRLVDILTIEIEAVNTTALTQLEKEGVVVIPSPAAINIIRNKIRQKDFYSQLQIPTAAHQVTTNRDDIKNLTHFLPAVHKLSEGGYDGKGVQIIETLDDIEKAFDTASVLEKLIPVKKELAIIVAMSRNGKSTIYPAVEMVFDPVLNLLDFQICPADLSDEVLWKAEAMALQVVKGLQSPGLFAVELFVDKLDNVWVNETAPRVHNSGHHTIEAHYTSQFDMLWRILLDFPLGNTKQIISSGMVNIVGAEGHQGYAVYEGLSEILQMENAFIHLYGKKETKPGRKMGHVTLLSSNRQDIIFGANKIKHLLQVTSKDNNI